MDFIIKILFCCVCYVTQHEQFRSKHQQNDKLLRQLGHMIAKIHAMKVPISKRSDWFLKQIEEYLINGLKKPDMNDIVEKNQLKFFKENDLLKELVKMNKLLDSVNSPTVFCHSDFRGSNILVTGEEPDEKLIMVDFEYSAYGARGSDLSVFMTEWNKEFFDFTIELPDDEVLKKFAEFYLEGMDMIEPGYSTLDVNSVQHLIKEIKVYTLANLMFFVAFMLNQSESLMESVPFEREKQLVSFWEI